MKILFFFMLVACSSRPSGQGALTESAKNLEIYAQKPKDCQVVGKVVGTDENGSPEMARNHAMNQAAELKASGIFIDQEVPNGSRRSVYATAYQCQ